MSDADFRALLRHQLFGLGAVPPIDAPADELVARLCVLVVEAEREGDRRADFAAAVLSDFHVFKHRRQRIAAGHRSLAAARGSPSTRATSGPLQPGARRETACSTMT